MTSVEPKAAEPDQQELFRRVYGGKTLGVVGGRPTVQQIRKLSRLGVRVEWLPMSHDGRRSQDRLPDRTVNAIENRRVDLLLIYTRCIGHNQSGRVAACARSPGQPRLPVVRSSTLNAGAVAGLFLSHLHANRKVPT